MSRESHERDVLGIPGYRHLSVIGGGASSTVYKAEDVELARWVAIKVLHTDDPEDPARKRFKREGTITANLGKHPHIVQVLATGFAEGGTPFVVMELFEQGSIADRLRTSGAFAVADTVDIGVKIADAVSAAHRAGVLHRDIKPQNILLSEYGPALGDFGIARSATNLEWSQSLDQLTPMHAAPEVLLGGTSTVQSDLYSLGSTLYTMLAGRPPFAGPPGEAPLRFQVRVMQDPVPPIARADVPKAMAEVLEQALAKSPADRPTSAAELGAALQACIVEPDHGPPSASHATRGGGSHASPSTTGASLAAPVDVGQASEGDATMTRRRPRADPARATTPGGTDLGDIPTVLPEVPGIASFLGPGTAHGPGKPDRQPATEPAPHPAPGPAPLLDPFVGLSAPSAAPGSVPSQGRADAIAGDGTATVHRPIHTLDPEPPPSEHEPRYGGRRKVAVAIAAVLLLVVGAGALVASRSPGRAVPVKKVHTVTTVARDKPANLALTGTAGNAVLQWTDPAGNRLRYLVVEVTTHGNKVLGKTAPGRTSLVVPGVDPATTQDCFEVTAVLSATTVGAPGSWCPTGESVAGG